MTASRKRNNHCGTLAARADTNAVIPEAVQMVSAIALPFHNSYQNLWYAISLKGLLYQNHPGQKSYWRLGKCTQPYCPSVP